MGREGVSKKSSQLQGPVVVMVRKGRFLLRKALTGEGGRTRHGGKKRGGMNWSPCQSKSLSFGFGKKKIGLRAKGAGVNMIVLGGLFKEWLGRGRASKKGTLLALGMGVFLFCAPSQEGEKMERPGPGGKRGRPASIFFQDWGARSLCYG